MSTTTYKLRGVDDLRCETRILKTEAAPTCLRFHRLRHWRWDVTFWRALDDTTRQHAHAVGGFCFTPWGASLAAGREVRRRLRAAEEALR